MSTNISANNPKEAYKALLSEPNWREDTGQAVVVLHLQRIHSELMAKTFKHKHSWYRRSNVSWSRPVKGLYIWGDVGRGKTVLMDLFYNTLPFESKRRQHFNHFMQDVHKMLQKRQGESDPIESVADEISAKVKVLCFDEFYVSDIADAMILGTLFTALFERNVCVVTTSNLAPDDLYKDGLKRDRFMPAIEAIKANMTTLHVDDGLDHRFSEEHTGEKYYTPLKGERTFMINQFQLLSESLHEPKPERITLYNRSLKALGVGENVIWFDFSVICGDERSQDDYISLAKDYTSILISNIPQLNHAMDDYAKRFLMLVDEFYDNNINLIISASVPIADLYSGARLAFAYQRIQSRLQSI